jgi:hypothetical protein
LYVAPQHLVGAARRDPGEIGVRAVHHARASPLVAVGQQRRGEVARGVALARARGAVQEVRVRGPVLQRRAEDGSRVGVLLQHPVRS